MDGGASGEGEAAAAASAADAAAQAEALDLGALMVSDRECGSFRAGSCGMHAC